MIVQPGHSEQNRAARTEQKFIGLTISQEALEKGKKMLINMNTVNLVLNYGTYEEFRSQGR